MIIKLEEGEKLLYETRRHWFIFIMEVIGLLIVALLPIIFFAGFIITETSIYHERLLPLGIFITAVLWLMLWIIFWILWTTYHLDVWYVTDRRLIDIEKIWLFSHQVSELRLDKIQDITVEMHGFFSYWLRFGNIHVQTAGQASKIKITHVPQPHRLKEIIWEAHNKAIASRQ